MDSVRIKSVTPQRFASLRTRTTPFEIGAALSRMLEAVWKQLGRQPHVTVGPAIARFHAFDEREIDVEAGYPVLESIELDRPVQLSQLPGGQAATLIVHGSYAALPEAYARVEAWMRANGFAPDAPPWDIYWVDATQVEAESDLRTEIVWPVRPAAS